MRYVAWSFVALSCWICNHQTVACFESVRFPLFSEIEGKKKRRVWSIVRAFTNFFVRLTFMSTNQVVKLVYDINYMWQEVSYILLPLFKSIQIEWACDQNRASNSVNTFNPNNITILLKMSNNEIKTEKTKLRHVGENIEKLIKYDKQNLFLKSVHRFQWQISASCSYLHKWWKFHWNSFVLVISKLIFLTLFACCSKFQEFIRIYASITLVSEWRLVCVKISSFIIY